LPVRTQRSDASGNLATRKAIAETISARSFRYRSSTTPRAPRAFGIAAPQVAQMPDQPPLDGPEPRLARLGDGDPDAGRALHGFPSPLCTLADTTIAPFGLNAV
jgi:hypothetical protein